MIPCSHSVHNQLSCTLAHFLFAVIVPHVSNTTMSFIIQSALSATLERLCKPPQWVIPDLDWHTKMTHTLLSASALHIEGHNTSSKHWQLLCVVITVQVGAIQVCFGWKWAVYTQNTSNGFRYQLPVADRPSKFIKRMHQVSMQSWPDENQTLIILSTLQMIRMWFGCGR